MNSSERISKLNQIAVLLAEVTDSFPDSHIPQVLVEFLKFSADAQRYHESLSDGEYKKAFRVAFKATLDCIAEKAKSCRTCSRMAAARNTAVMNSVQDPFIPQLRLMKLSDLEEIFGDDFVQKFRGM